MIELVNVKGWPQDASHFNFDDFIPEEDASIVKILRKAGASKFKTKTMTRIQIKSPSLLFVAVHPTGPSEVDE